MSSIVGGLREGISSSVPPELKRLRPGPELAVMLAGIDVERCSGHDRIVVLQAHTRMASHHQAEAYRAMASVVDHMNTVESNPEWAWEGAVAEIRVALNLTRRTADVEVANAVDLGDRLPRVGGSLARGEIDVRRARALLAATSHLSEGAAREVADRVLEMASDLTSGQVAARARRLAIEVDPESAEKRTQQSEQERRVAVEPTVDGTAHLSGFDLPAERAMAAADRVDRIARTLKRDGETRTIDQLRADVFLDLLHGADFSRVDARVTVSVDLATLARLKESAAELAGFGPVVAEIARRVADRGRGRWQYRVTDPGSGRLVDAGVLHRRPRAALRRQVELRAPVCVFPGCRMPSVSCDLDHRVAWSERGPTTDENLEPLCRHDHTVEQHQKWTYQALGDGRYRWVTRLGHTYTTPGPP